MKKVMAFGTFDILHKGHEHYLKEAKSYGSYLIVLVARDQNIVKIKGKKAVHDENFRLEQIAKLDFVDEAILGNIEDFFRPIEEYKPNILCLGYDQETIYGNKLKEELKKRNIEAEIIRAKPFKENIYKSSILKKNNPV